MPSCPFQAVKPLLKDVRLRVLVPLVARAFSARTKKKKINFSFHHQALLHPLEFAGLWQPASDYKWLNLVVIFMLCSTIAVARSAFTCNIPFLPPFSALVRSLTKQITRKTTLEDIIAVCSLWCKLYFPSIFFHWPLLLRTATAAASERSINSKY